MTRCYLCNAETTDEPMLSGVVVCLACRRREGVYLDMTSPEQRAENDAFMRLFGEPHAMARMPPLDLGWHTATLGGKPIPGRIVSAVIAGHQVRPLKLPADSTIRPGDHIAVEGDEVKIVPRASELASLESDIFATLRDEFEGERFDDKMKECIVARAIELIMAQLPDEEPPPIHVSVDPRSPHRINVAIGDNARDAATRRAEEVRMRLYAMEMHPIRMLTREQLIDFGLDDPKDES